MSKATKIQWCDSTVNPVMGCDGCPLYPSTSEVVNRLAQQLASELEADQQQIRDVLKGAIGDRPFSVVYHERRQIAQTVGHALRVQGIGEVAVVAKAIEVGVASSLRCYAGLLHSLRGLNDLKPEKKAHAGYAPRFEQVTPFPGRTAGAAGWADLSSTEREEKPWLNGLPRLIFVSDMGDALSKDVSFEFLKREIVDVATSSKGKAHVWLWLTKRPRQMADFSDWLTEQGAVWPDNLVPMTSVLDQKMAVQVKQLKRIPAKVRGLSVEPLWEAVDLDLEGIDWVIVGGESGAYAKPFDLAWARALRDLCEREGKSFFMKQLGANPFENGNPLSLEDEHGGEWDEWPDDLRIRQVPEKFQSLTTPHSEPVGSTVATVASPKEDEEAFERLNAIVIEGAKAFVAVGKALEEIRSRKLWKAGGFHSWETYCDTVLCLTKAHADRLIRASAIATMIGQAEPIGSGREVLAPRNESQVRPLFKLQDQAKQVEAWSRAAKQAEGQPTARQVIDAVAELMESSDSPAPAKATVSQKRADVMLRLSIAIAAKSSWDEVQTLFRELEQLTGSRNGRTASLTLP